MTLPDTPFGRSARKSALGVRDLAHALGGHLEDADLGRAPEAILLRAQRPEGVTALALEGEDRVDEVLEHLRAGERAVFGDVADEERRDAVFLGALDHSRGDLAELADRAGRALERHRPHRLNAVEDERLRLHLGDGPLDGVEVVLGEDEELVGHGPEPARARAAVCPALSSPVT